MYYFFLTTFSTLFTVGIALGSILMKRVKLKGSVGKAALVCIGLGVTGTLISLAFLIPGCQSVKLIAKISNRITLPKSDSYNK